MIVLNYSFFKEFMGDLANCLKKLIILHFFQKYLLIILWKETLVVLTRTTKSEIQLLCLKLILHVFTPKWSSYTFMKAIWYPIDIKFMFLSF